MAKDKVEELFNALSEKILEYGPEAESDLEDLLESHRPDSIFKLDPGPERNSRAARLLGEMRELLGELRGEVHSKEEGASRGRVVVSKVDQEVPGVYDGFRYVLMKLPDGRWGAKITRRGRQIIESPDAPKIIDSPDLKKRFKDQDSAELAVRRVINTALIWYNERGIAPVEKARKTERGRAGIYRRTAGQVEARERESKERSEQKAEERRRERIRERKREEKVRGKKDRPKMIQPPGAGRKLEYIPKKNPSESEPLQQANKAISLYKEWKGRWEQSLKDGKADFRAVMAAYDWAENARANFEIAGHVGPSEKASKIKSNLRTTIVDIFNLCARELSGRKFTVEGSDSGLSDKLQTSGDRQMEKAETAWNKYNESSDILDLIQSYSHLRCAHEHYKISKDADGIGEAKARISTVLKEIKNRLKA